MYLISGITDDPKQNQTLVLPNGKQATLYLEYKPQQTGWFMNLTYGDFDLKNVRVVNSSNILHQFRNLIPFGVGCLVDQDQEPMLQKDFLYLRARLYVLSEAQVLAFEDILSG